MASVNKVIIVGNLGRDPELKDIPNGTSVCNFNVATSFEYKGETRTEWHRIVAFGKLAGICGQYLHKGSQVYIEGRLQTRKWKDKSGNDRYSTEIVCINLVMLGRAGVSSGEEETPVSESTASAAESTTEGDKPDGDLPF